MYTKYCDRPTHPRGMDRNAALFVLTDHSCIVLRIPLADHKRTAHGGVDGLNDAFGDLTVPNEGMVAVFS